MPMAKVSSLKQSPYGFLPNGERVDPTRDGVQKAIDERRFSEKIMDRDYETVKKEILCMTNDPAEGNRLMREFHNERVADLVRTKDVWLDRPDRWPITVNQFNQVIEGNHRFRAIRYLELDEVEVVIKQESAPRWGFDLPDIW